MTDNSFINIKCDNLCIHAGNPIRFIKKRYDDCKSLQKEYEQTLCY